MKTFIPLIIIHIIISQLIQSFPFFVTIHAYLVLILGIYFSLFDNNTSRTMPILFYIVGSELLWRGFGADVIWEYGKYSAILIMLINILRLGANKIKNKKGLFILLCFIPSFFILVEFDRIAISHAISGPFSLAIAILLFSNQTLDRINLIKQLIALLLPIISLLTIMTVSTLQHGEIDVYASYVKEYTTAGLGPNQAANILGLGVLAFFLLYIIKKDNKSILLIFGLLMIFQTMITHSRGGFWNAILAISVCITFLFTEKEKRLKFLLGTSILSLFLYLFAFPQIDKIAKGTISSRYADTDISHRENIIETELRAFKDNPLMGIGPGSSRSFRVKNYNSSKHTHTEYTRLLSEHGIFGLIVIFILLSIINSLMRINNGLAKSVSLALITWSVLFMFH